MKKIASILLKIIGYLTLLCGIIGGLDQIINGNFDPIYSTAALIIFIFIGTICLNFSKSLQKANDLTANEEVFVVNETILIEKPKQKHWKKICISILIVGICTILMICFIGLSYYYNAIFYEPFYLILMVWYIYLLWKNAPISAGDYLLLPLLQKIGLFKSYSNDYDLRKALLKTFVPVYAGTIIISTIVVILNTILSPSYNHEISIGSVILFIPIMAWIIFFVYSYGSQWVNKVKRN